MQIDSSFNQLTQSDIKDLELNQQINLPKEYVSFLLKNNGGRSKQKVFTYKLGNEKRKAIVDWFLGIHSGEYDNLAFYLRTYYGRVPADLIPIAHDPGGNLICLSSSNGAVYFWDHDYEVEEGEVPDYRNVYFIANNLDEFLDGLSDFE